MTSRFPPIAAEDRTEDQRRFAEDAQGRETGPFHAYMRNPDLHRRLQPLRHRIREQTAFGPALRELAILMVARHWRSAWMFDDHQRLAMAAGVGDAAIEAARRGERPPGLAADQAALHDFVAGMLARGRVSDPVFAAAVAAFGQAGVLDLINLIGFYATTAMVLNVAEPDDGPSRNTL